MLYFKRLGFMIKRGKEVKIVFTCLIEVGGEPSSNNFLERISTREQKCLPLPGTKIDEEKTRMVDSYMTESFFKKVFVDGLETIAFRRPGGVNIQARHFD